MRQQTEAPFLDDVVGEINPLPGAGFAGCNGVCQGERVCRIRLAEEARRTILTRILFAQPEADHVFVGEEKPLVLTVLETNELVLQEEATNAPHGQEVGRGPDEAIEFAAIWQVEALRAALDSFRFENGDDGVFGHDGGSLPHECGYNEQVWTVFLVALLCGLSPPPAGGRAEALATVKALAEAGTPEALARLRSHLEHPVQDVRAAALLSLARLADPSAIPQALEWLSSPHLETRLDALAVLAVPAVPLDEDSTQRIEAQLADTRMELRLATFAVLQARGRAVAPGLLALLAEDEHAAVRAAALAALPPGPHPAARQLAVSRLEDVDLGVRFAALSALGRSRDPEARPALEHVLGAREPELVVAALAALGELGQPASFPRVAPLAMRPGAGPVTEQAVRTLARLGDPRGARVLTERLQRFGVADALFNVVGQALRDVGTAAEAALLALLEGGVEERLAVATLRLLSQVGTQASVEPVAAMVARTSAAVPAALDCLSQLAARGANLQPVWPLLAPAFADLSPAVRTRAQVLDARAALTAGRKVAGRTPLPPPKH